MALKITGLDLGDVQVVSEDHIPAVEVLRGNYNVGYAGEELVVAFRGNMGKGSGTQIVPVTEIQGVISTLEELVGTASLDNDEDADRVPAPQRIRQTFRLVRNPGVTYRPGGEKVPPAMGGEDWYEFACSSGKGSKPTKIRVSEMPEFLALFRQRNDAAIEALRARGMLANEEVDLSE